MTGTALQLGLHLPNAGPLADAGLLREAAVAAEESGYDSLWLYDHLLSPIQLGSSYPYTPDGTYAFSPEHPFFDALATLGVLAGLTQRVRLGTAVLVPGYRHPLTLGRYLATLDNLCRGRLIMGVGAGWMVEEFAAMGVDPRSRGRRLEELVAALRAMWDNDAIAFDGEFFSWPESAFLPRPYTGRRIPLLIGGHSDRAIERAARIGDGWAVTVAGSTGISRDALRDALQAYRDQLERHGRDPEQAHVHVFALVFGRAWNKDGPRPLLRGTADDLRADAADLAAMGVTTVDAYLPARTGEEYLAGVRAVAAALAQDS